MLDMHCHILPKVDDGSSSLEESLDMIKIAYQDGIRAIIATPHKNHPIDFNSQDSVTNSYDLLKRSVMDLYPDFELYLGAEFYVRGDYIVELEKNIQNLVINSTKYILIEFDRQAKYDFISEAVHEFKVRGLIPILAHLEMYADITQKPEKAYRLRNQGALIQLTGSSITGKRGKNISKFCENLLKNSSVDFVASDAHGKEYRKPLLYSSYQKVLEIVGEKEAHKMFTTNQELLVSGNQIHTKEIQIQTQNKDKKTRSSKNKLIATAVAAICLFAFFIIGPAYQKTSVADNTVKHVPSDLISNQAYDKKQEEIKIEKQSKAQAQLEKETQEQKVEKKEQINEKSKQKAASKSDIETRYYQKLRSYQNSYVGQLEGIVANMGYAKKNVTDQELLGTTLEAYKQELFSLEAQSDNTVYAALYDMQNELEEQNYDVSKVQQLRDEYNGIKMSKQKEYMNRLGQ